MVTRRPVSVAALLVATTSLLAACGSSGSSNSTGTTASGSGGGNTVAARFVLGGAPECPQRPYCLPGLQKTYNLHFQSFKPLDAGGPLTVSAIKTGSVQVGELFTTDGNITANNWVLLQDDKHLQPADNVTPVVTSGINQAYGQNLQNLVNSVSAKITTQELTKLNSQVTVGQQDSDAVAKQWLKQNNLQPSSTGPAKAGPTIVVGSANFSEDVTLADIYADALSANGYPVSKKLQIGSREIYFPALKQGQINFVPDYAGTLLTFVDKSQTATTNPQQNNAALAAALQPQGLVVYQSAPAQDVNGFVVTGATASKYNLKTLSDLGKNA